MTMEIVECEEQKILKDNKNEHNPRVLQETIKWANVCIAGVTEGVRENICRNNYQRLHKFEEKHSSTQPIS